MSKAIVGEKVWFIGSPVNEKEAGFSCPAMNEGEVVAVTSLAVTVKTENGDHFTALHENLYNDSQDALMELIFMSNKPRVLQS